MSGEKLDHCVPSRVEKSETRRTGDDKTPRADDATGEPCRNVSRKPNGKRKDQGKTKQEIYRSARNSLPSLNPLGHQEEHGISFHTTLSVESPGRVDTPSPISTRTEDQNQLALVGTDGGDKGQTSTQRQGAGSALEPFTPSASTGAVKISSNSKNDLLDYPTHASDLESREGMETHALSQQGFCTAEPGKDSPGGATFIFHKGRNNLTQRDIQLPTTFTSCQSKRNAQVERLPRMTKENLRTYGSIHEPLCSSGNTREPGDNLETRKPKELFSSQIRDSGQMQMLLTELLSRDSSLIIVIRESPSTIMAGTGTQSFGKSKHVEPDVLLTSRGEERTQMGQECYHKGKEKIHDFWNGPRTLEPEDLEDNSV